AAASTRKGTRAIQKCFSRRPLVRFMTTSRSVFVLLRLRGPLLMVIANGRGRRAAYRSRSGSSVRSDRERPPRSCPPHAELIDQRHAAPVEARKPRLPRPVALEVAWSGDRPRSRYPAQAITPCPGGCGRRRGRRHACCLARGRG